MMAYNYVRQRHGVVTVTTTWGCNDDMDVWLQRRRRRRRHEAAASDDDDIDMRLQRRRRHRHAAAAATKTLTRGGDDDVERRRGWTMKYMYVCTMKCIYGKKMIIWITCMYYEMHVTGIGNF